MSWLRFLIKLSFICNVCYLVGFVIRMLDDPGKWGEAGKHIMVLGGLVAAPLNILTILLAIVLLLLKKVRWSQLHPYIFVLNVVILLLQLELFLP
ncbi:hypothetical protein ACWKWU_11710 [Chitinophaga lutea]